MTIEEIRKIYTQSGDWEMMDVLLKRIDELETGVVDKRALDAIKIKEAYKTVEKSLQDVGKLLRTTEAGKYMWSSNHKSAVTGLRIVVEKLRHSVPDYGGEKL